MRGRGQTDLKQKNSFRADHYVLCINVQKTHLKVLVVVRIEAKTGHKAVHHEFHIGILAAGPPPEGFGWVEQQCLVGMKGKAQVTHGNFFSAEERAN